jgi:hypothetical protein
MLSLEGLCLMEASLLPENLPALLFAWFAEQDWRAVWATVIGGVILMLLQACFG